MSIQISSVISDAQFTCLVLLAGLIRSHDPQTEAEEAFDMVLRAAIDHFLADNYTPLKSVLRVALEDTPAEALRQELTEARDHLDLLHYASGGR